MKLADPAARLRCLRFVFGLAALGAGWAAAQVTPAEPFGGRPFGAANTNPPAPAAPVVPQQPAQPMVVQPGAGPVVVQPQQQQAQQAQPQPNQPAPNMAGPIGRPTSSVNPQPPVNPAAAAMQQANTPPQQQANNAPAPQQPQQNGNGAAPPITPVAPPAQVTPPFAANRPATTTAGAAQAQPVRGLPPDAPKLVISGAVYSPDPARRMLIVNGQVVREGADIGSGVVLQEVRPESAVLDFRGNRYNVFF